MQEMLAAGIQDLLTNKVNPKIQRKICPPPITQGKLESMTPAKLMSNLGIFLEPHVGTEREKMPPAKDLCMLASSFFLFNSLPLFHPLLTAFQHSQVVLEQN